MSAVVLLSGEGVLTFLREKNFLGLNLKRNVEGLNLRDDGEDSSGGVRRPEDALVVDPLEDK